MFPHSNKQEEIGAGAFERRLLLFIYRRVSDEYLDPLAFEPSSLLGVPNLMQAYKKGNVALINALGNGVTDDKGIYYFVPKMIKYYLHEEPILHNAPTYLPYYPEDYDYILSHLEKLVIKDVSEAGGYGVMFGRVLVLMVMPAAALLAVFMVVCMCLFRAVAVGYCDIRLIRLCNPLNFLRQAVRRVCFDAQLFGRKHKGCFLHLRQPADIPFYFRRAIGTAKMFQQIYLTCHADPSYVKRSLNI